MSRDFEDDDHKSFITLQKSRPFDPANAPSDSDSDKGTVISQAAWRLHAYATVTSLCEDNFGFVPDNYLSSIRAETDLTALELVTAGLWVRAVHGYLIHDPHMLQLALHADEHVRQIHQSDKPPPTVNPCPGSAGVLYKPRHSSGRMQGGSIDRTTPPSPISSGTHSGLHTDLAQWIDDHPRMTVVLSRRPWILASLSPSPSR
jgi:hypothetical protein